MIVTESRIPVPLGIIIYINYIPDPMAPRKSAMIVSVPMHIPPKVAAMGMYLFKYSFTLLSRCPTMLMSYSLSCLATYLINISNNLSTSLGEDPDTSIQVFEKRAHVPKMKAE
jgi:ABC-type spermidine/putrescine transport system permease subunit II